MDRSTQRLLAATPDLVDREMARLGRRARLDPHWHSEIRTSLERCALALLPDPYRQPTQVQRAVIEDIHRHLPARGRRQSAPLHRPNKSRR